MFQGLPKYPDASPNAFWGTQLPAHWKVLPGLALLLENKRRNSDLAEDRVLSLSFGRVVVKPVEHQGGLVPDSYEGYQILDPGDLVVRPTDLQNDKTSIRVGVVRDRGIITSAYLGLRAREPWVTGYAYHYLATVDSTKRIYGMGSGLRQQLSWADIKRMPCLSPPIAEQKSIIKYLAHAEARISRAVEAKRRLVKLLNEQQVVISSELVDSTDQTVVRVKEVCSHIVDCKNRTPEFVEGGDYHVIRTTCVRSGEFSIEGSYPTDQLGFTEWTKRGAPRRGDVLFTREAPAGEAALMPDRTDLCLGQRMMYFRPNVSIVLPEYLVLALYAKPARQFISNATNGSTVGHLRLRDVGALPLRLPPIDLQRQIVDTHRKRTAEINRTKQRVEREISLLGEFRTRLVADVVTGQVDVRMIAASLSDIDPAANHWDATAVKLTDVDDLAETVDASRV